MRQEQEKRRGAPIAKKGLFDFLKPKRAQPGKKDGAAAPNAQKPAQLGGSSALAPASPGGKSSGGNLVQNRPNIGKIGSDGSSDAKPVSKANAANDPLRGFYPVASMAAKLFPMLEFELEASGKKQGVVEYTSSALLVFTAIFTFLSLLSGVVIQFKFTEGIDFRFRIAAVGFSALAAFGIFFYYMLIPRWLSSKRMDLINKDLLFATRHLMIQTSAGVPLYDAIVSVSEDFDDSSLSYDKKGREYGEVGREFAHIVLQVRSGKELTAALEESAAASPSENFRKVVWQLSNANRTGTKIGLVLHDTVNFLAAEQIISIRSYGAQLSTLALFYMLGCIIAPTMGIVVLAIGANILPNLPVNESTFLAILVLLTLVQAFFVGMIKSRRPTVSL